MKFVSAERCGGGKAYLLDQMEKKLSWEREGRTRSKGCCNVHGIACEMKMRKIIKDDGSHGFK